MKRFLFLTFICIFALLLIGCGDTDDVPAPHEHTLVSHEGKATTCTDYGWSAYSTCSGCGYTTYTAISPLGHDLGATPTASGDLHLSICTRCNASIGSDHTWVEPTVTAPTCTEKGSTVYTCTECGAEKSEPIAALGHDYAEVSTPAVNVHVKPCSRCNDVLTYVHTWGEPTVTAPTCTEKGSVSFTCTECGIEQADPIAALGHDYAEVFTPSGDVHVKACSRCSDVLSGSHTWGDPTPVTSSTCTQQGSERYTCTECGAEKTEPIAELGHDFTGEYVPSGDGHSRLCTRCSATDEVLSHTWQSKEVTKQPTCTETGTEVFVCTDCGKEKTEVLDIDPDVHERRGWVTTVAATALVEGEKELRCIDCCTVLDTERIPADVESMDRIYLTGNYEGAYVNGKKKEVDMTVTYVYADGTSFDSYATIKAQGATSTSYPKKNYTIKFYKDAEHDSKNKIDLGWGKQNKYVMKANWVDYSQSRNVMSCRLWGDIVATRATSANQQKLAALKTNGGAIDGYPIAVYMNGSFHGLYTMNVPKDEWMFGMGEKDENGNKSTTEALLATDDWNHTDFYSTIGEFYENSDGDIVAKDGGWEVIYYGGDDYNWVAESFDALILFCQNNDGEAFRNGIREHLDVESAIDYLIYMYANCMHDNASKNMLWATYDGKTWIASVYDQDGSFGQVWDGVRLSAPSSSLPSVKSDRINVGVNYGPTGNNNPKFILWDRIWNNFTAEVLARYDELRATVLSTEYMIAEYKKFEAMIPESMFEAELEVWASARDSWWRGKGKNTPYDYTAYHYDYIYTWIENRMTCYDEAIAKIKAAYGY